MLVRVLNVVAFVVVVVVTVLSSPVSTKAAAATWTVSSPSAKNVVSQRNTTVSLSHALVREEQHGTGCTLLVWIAESAAGQFIAGRTLDPTTGATVSGEVLLLAAKQNVQLQNVQAVPLVDHGQRAGAVVVAYVAFDPSGSSDGSRSAELYRLVVDACTGDVLDQPVFVWNVVNALFYDECQFMLSLVDGGRTPVLTLTTFGSGGATARLEALVLDSRNGLPVFEPVAALPGMVPHTGTVLKPSGTLYVYYGCINTLEELCTFEGTVSVLDLSSNDKYMELVANTTVRLPRTPDYGYVHMTALPNDLSLISWTEGASPNNTSQRLMQLWAPLQGNPMGDAVQLSHRSAMLFEASPDGAFVVFIFEDKDQLLGVLLAPTDGRALSDVFVVDEMLPADFYFNVDFVERYVFFTDDRHFVVAWRVGNSSNDFVITRAFTVSPVA